MFWRNRTEPRRLSAGELLAAQAVFCDAIDWHRVRLHARPFIWLQPRGTAVSPNGAIYFHAADHLTDFSGEWRAMAWLIHELTHVWQHQSGQWVIPRGLWERRYRYGLIDPRRPLARWGIEQQAAIIEDWFRLTQGQTPWRGSGSVADYRAVIPFLPAGANR